MAAMAENTPGVSIGNLLPVGNIGRGLAWAYYTSFLNIVLKDIQIAMDAFAKDNNLSISRKVYLLLPMSCFCPNTLTDIDAKVKRTCQLRPDPIQITRAGKPRKYNNTVYKIEKDNQVYHFVAECCSVVKSMLLMEEGKIAHLTAEEKQSQVLIFDRTLKDILNHNYPGRCRIIRYNDKERDGPNLSDRLLEHLEKDLRQTARPLERGVQDLSIEEQQGAQKAEEGLQTVDNRSEKGADFYDVFIVCGDSKDDHKLAKEIRDFLETKGKTCATNLRDLVPGGVTLTDMGAFTKRSKKTIMILSDETTDKELSICCMLRPPEHDQLSKTVLPITVLRELKKKNKDIEDFTKTMTYIENTQPDFWDCLLKAVNANLGQLPPFPAGEIAPGFAWNYFYGYMQNVLPGLKESLKLYSYDNIRGRVSYKRYLFMPKSGTMLEKFDQIPGVEKYNPGHIRLMKNVAGNCNRDYDSIMYKVKSLETKEDWYFVGEYITPLVVLKDMKDGLVAGLSTDVYADQVAGLYSHLEKILSQEHAREQEGCWRLFPYDDQEGLDGLSNDILQAVQEDVAEQGVQEDVAEQGVQEDVAEQGVQESVAEQGVQEDVAEQGVQEDVANKARCQLV